jgi:invasion protein IalB
MRVAVAIVLLLLLPAASWAQPEKRIALLIGNQSYDPSVGILRNPHNDIAVVGEALRVRGFELIPPIKDARRSTILGGVRELVRRLNAAGSGAIGFIYYSGHGAAEKDTNINYLIPVDAKEPGTTAFWDESVKLDDVLRLLDGARSAAKFVVFDACRNELQLPTKDTSKGLIPVAEQQGMFIAYASAPGRTASDRGDRSGPYAAALAGELGKPGLDHLNLFQNVKEAVLASTGGAQQPWESNGLGRRIYLTGLPRPAATSPQPPQASGAAEAWTFVKDTGDIAMLEAFATRFKDTFYADMARARIETLKKTALATTPSGPPSGTQPAPAQPSNSAWVKLCDKGLSGVQTCATYHERLDVTTGMALVAVALGEPGAGGKRRLQALVPLGMLLQPGARVTIYPKDLWDRAQKDEKVDDPRLIGLKASFAACDPLGCVGEMELAPDVVSQLTTSGGLIVFAINPSGSPAAFPVPLSGLQEALSGTPTNLTAYTSARDDLLKGLETKNGAAVGSASRRRPFTTDVPVTAPPLATSIKSLNTGQSAWVKLCEKANSVSKNKEGKEEKRELNICLTHHERLDGTTGMVIVSAALREVEGQQTPYFMVMVPLGVAQQPGLQVALYPKQVWEKLRSGERIAPSEEAQLKEVQLAYTLCHPAGCTAEMQASPALIADLKAGGGAVVHAVNSAGGKVSFPVPLVGFGQAHEGAPVDNKKYGEARKALMEQIAKRQLELHDEYKRKKN